MQRWHFLRVPSIQQVLEKQGISIQPLLTWTRRTKLGYRSRALSLTWGWTAPGSRICCSCWYTCYSKDSYQYPLFYLQNVRRAKCYPPVNTSAFTWIWLDLLMLLGFWKYPLSLLTGTTALWKAFLHGAWLLLKHITCCFSSWSNLRIFHLLIFTFSFWTFQPSACPRSIRFL